MMLLKTDGDDLKLLLMIVMASVMVPIVESDDV